MGEREGHRDRDRSLLERPVTSGIECEELVKPFRSRPGLLRDEDAAVAQHPADFNRYDGFVAVDHQVERGPRSRPKLSGRSAS
jgi:hypothetical protein